MSPCRQCHALFEGRPGQRYCCEACRYAWKSANRGSTLTKVMMLGDVHVPYHDKAALSCAAAAFEHVKPDVLVIMGDFVDCYTVSKFDRETTRFPLLEDELRVARLELGMFMGAEKTYYLEGNHEHRLTSYVTRQAPALAGMVSIREQLGIDKRGWAWVDYPKHVDIGDLRVQHEPIYGGKYGTQRTLEVGGARSWAFGHTHHGAAHFAGTPDGKTIHAINTGWLGDFESLAFHYCPPSRARAQWRHGFGLAYLEGDSVIGAQFVPIEAGRCVVEGRVVR